MIFFWMVMAHFIGDWGLQSNWIAQNKGKMSIVMVAHCMIVTACLSIALTYCNVFSIWITAVLYVSHGIIDKLKCEFFPAQEWAIWVDQLWHIIIYLIIVTLMI